MTDDTQPEALRLADRLHHEQPTVLRIDAEHAGEELRRQHARIAELEAQLEAVGAGGAGQGWRGELQQAGKRIAGGQARAAAAGGRAAGQRGEAVRRGRGQQPDLAHDLWVHPLGHRAPDRHALPPHVLHAVCVCV